MEASIVDLRYKTNDILKALERNESVTVLYHGKVKATILPARKKTGLKVQDHPFFGMHASCEQTVQGELEDLRRPRHDL